MTAINYGKLAISLEKHELTENKLTMDVKIKNNSGMQSIIFPNEEIRIIADESIILLDNYTIENNLDAGQETKGQLFFKIKNEPKKIILQFGKPSLPQKIIKLK
ncbi:MAG: hypothetical protein PHG04_01975 [Candidatus Nanoarchaeia archaeon]|nr:hypothetical protein [Candidatus Nanoarchaeia archaeon]